MPHGNFWGCDGRLGLFERFRAAQVRDKAGNLQGWRENGEPPIEYIRPSYGPWREFYAETIHKLVNHFELDAFFLDQLGGSADDPDCDFECASQDFLDTLRAACPRTVFAGEIIHERCRSLPLWQVWGTPWCGLPAEENKPASDLLGHLFGDHALMPHMGMPAAVPVPDSWPAYYWYVNQHGHETAARRANAWHRQIGVMPSVRVNYRDYGLDDLARAILLN